MRIAVQTPQYDCTAEDLLATWRHAEALGYDGAWLMDHLEPIVAPATVPMLEAWTTLAALAAGTDVLRLGVLVTANTFRPPALLARMAATVDRLSGGRLDVGLGMTGGYAAGEHAANGIPFPPARDRLAMLDESCRVLRLLWTEEAASFSGRHYRLDAVSCEPKPLQVPLPLLIGGTGPRTLDVVTRHADRWNGVGSRAMLADAVATLRRRCEEIGRDPSTLELTARNDFYLASRESEGRARLEQMARFWGTSVEDARSRTWIGTADQVVEALSWYRDEGFAEVILGLAPPYDEACRAMLERVAAEVVPHLCDAAEAA